MPEELLPKSLANLPDPEKNHPVPQKESKSLHLLKYFLLGIFSVIILVAIGTGVFFYKSKSSNPQISERIISQTPTPTIEPISKWKIYADKTLSFKYPSNYFLEIKDGSIYVNKEKNFSMSSIFTISYDEKYLIDLTSIKKCSEELKTNEYGIEEESCIGKNGGDEPIKTTTIDGKSANDFYITYPGLGGGPRTIQLKNPTVVIWPSTSEDMLNQILSTVKFN